MVVTRGKDRGMNSAEISELLRDGAASTRMLAELQGDSNHLRDAAKMEAAADGLYNQEDTIEELRAQLAKAVDIITEILAEEKARAYFEETSDTEWIVDELGCLIEYLSGQAKADAEVMRCAEEETKLHKVGCNASGEISEVECNCALCNAVRAAKEVGDE